MKRRFFKLAALMLVLMLALTGCSLIEVDQERDMAQPVATVNGVAITKGDVIDQYLYLVNTYAYYYESYGMQLTEAMVADLRNDVIDMYIEQELLAQKAKELNLTDFSDASFAEADAEAVAYFDTLIEEHAGHINTTGMSEDAARKAIVAHMKDDGITLEAVIEDYRRGHVTELVYNHIIAGIEVSDADVQAAYDAKVAADEEQYSASSYMYELNLTNGEAVAWNPEGYRTVKHILFLTTDEQDAALNELHTQLVDVETAISVLTGSNTADALTAPKSLDELNAEKAVLEKALADKEAEVLASFTDKVKSVSDRLAAGETFDALMAELGEDPGMKQEPGISTGYYVSAASTMWDPAFRDAAMSIEKIGDISEPVLSASGVHIIYYNSDVPAGAVSLDALYDVVLNEALAGKQGDAYTAQYEEWLSAAAVKKYPKVLP